MKNVKNVLQKTKILYFDKFQIAMIRKNIMKSMWIYNQLLKSYEFGYFSNWHPPQTANIENPGETFFKNFYVKKFLPI